LKHLKADLANWYSNRSAVPAMKNHASECISHICSVAIVISVVCGKPLLAGGNESQTATVGKQVHAAQVAVDAARMELNRIRLKARAQLTSQPEWASTLTELKNAQAACDAAKLEALAALVKGADYQKLLAERERAQSVLAAAGTSSSADDAQVQKAGDLVFNDGLEIKHREQQMLDHDEKYKDAKTRLNAVHSKADRLELQAGQEMKNDPAYAQTIQQLNTAEERLKSARQQLAQAAQAEQQQRAAKLRAAEQQQSF
jgi:hypothetical protein